MKGRGPRPVGCRLFGHDPRGPDHLNNGRTLTRVVGSKQIKRLRSSLEEPSVKNTLYEYFVTADYSRLRQRCRGRWQADNGLLALSFFDPIEFRSQHAPRLSSV